MQRCTALTHRTKGISAPAIAARQRVRTRAAEAFDSGLAGAVAFGLGSIGIIAGTAFAGLYNVEKQARETVERKLERTQEELAKRESRVKRLKEELREAQEYGKQTKNFEKRLEDQMRDNFKLEKALEMKDGQIESFMIVAQRQIAYLEERVREVQRERE